MAYADFLSIGHVTQDITEDGSRVGGTVAYAALTAARLGLNAAAATSAPQSFDVSRMLPGVKLLCHPSEKATVFQNKYLNGQRSQRVISVASPIGPSHIPEEARACHMMLLGPVAGEVEPGLVDLFSESPICLISQGWLRRREACGYVKAVKWEEAHQILPKAHVVVVSEEDLLEKDVIQEWATLTPILVVTRGARGASLHWEGAWHTIPAVPAEEVDPTGAGDVFAAAFLISYYQTGDPLKAGYFASCAAALSMEHKGLDGILSREGAEECLRLLNLSW